MLNKIINKYYIFENLNKNNNNIHIDDEYNLKIIKNINQIDLKILDKDDFKILENGLLYNAEAICIFYNNKIAHVTWIAFSKTSQNFVDNIPTKIDWKNSIIWGRAFTSKHHRNKHLYSYAQQEMQKYLIEIGIQKQYFSIKAKNLPSLIAMQKFNPKVIKIFYRLRVPFFRNISLVFNHNNKDIYKYTK